MSSALGELMRTYYPVLLQFAEGMVTNRAQAEDIAEEAFIQLWKKHESFDSLGAIRKFLWVTARHDCLDALRARETHARKLNEINIEGYANPESSSALHQMIRAEVLSDIYGTIRTLPKKMQQVFILSYIEGLKNKEIADQLHLAEQTVRNQKSRALEILRLRFKNSDLVIAFLAAVAFLKI